MTTIINKFTTKTQMVLKREEFTSSINRFCWCNMRWLIYKEKVFRTQKN